MGSARTAGRAESGTLIITDARLPMDGAGGTRRGLHDIEIREGVIAAVTPAAGRRPARRGGGVFDAGGRAVLPGFVDCHTHACWAGDRLDEWEMKLRGSTYLEILASGGGIMSTVRAVRRATEEGLAALLLARLERMLRCGTTTVEVKSGYGLSTRHELKMLRAIGRAGREARRAWGMTVVPTALLGHAIDPGVARREFVETTIGRTLPAVHEEFPGICVDAYCERGAWSVEECTRLFRRAGELGHPVRVHTDQFNRLGMTAAAVRLGAVSVDHLEATTGAQLRALGRAACHAVALPCCGFHLDGRFMSARPFLDGGGAGRLAIATNCNPGSAPCYSMPMVMALAVRRCGLSVKEAIDAATRAPAALLGFADRGVVAAGMRADLVVLNGGDARGLAYEFGDSPVRAVIAGGRCVVSPAPRTGEGAGSMMGSR